MESSKEDTDQVLVMPGHSLIVCVCWGLRLMFVVCHYIDGNLDRWRWQIVLMNGDGAFNSVCCTGIQQQYAVIVTGMMGKEGMDGTCKGGGKERSTVL